VTLDPDTEQLVRERMTLHGISFKQALNDAIRDGARGRVDYAFQQPTYDVGLSGDLTRATRMAGELEDEEVARKSRDGR
jgi:hypothetical protein